MHSGLKFPCPLKVPTLHVDHAHICSLLAGVNDDNDNENVFETTAIGLLHILCIILCDKRFALLSGRIRKTLFH